MPEVSDYEFKKLPRFPAVAARPGAGVDEQVTHQQIS
jgi:hypothetical protein